MPKPKNATAQPCPHSWSLTRWPEHVWPHSAGKGRYIIRSCRSSLIEAGAIVRVGRDIIVIGSAYSRWLDGHSNRVDGYPTIAPNQPPPDQRAA